MPQRPYQSSYSLEPARAHLSARLSRRRPEIERLLLDRVTTISETTKDLEYIQGLRGAVSAALTFYLSVVERGEKRAPPIPLALLAQARAAARHGVGLDAVLHRYFAGHTLLNDFIMQEAERGAEPICVNDVNHLIRDQVALLNRLIPLVTEEYGRETIELRNSAADRQSIRVRRLLAGELLDTSDLPYEFNAWHVGVLSAGPDARAPIDELASSLDRRTFLIRGDDSHVWAWFGGQQQMGSAVFERAASSGRSDCTSLAIGEPAFGLEGWRFTHQQARAVLPIAIRSGKGVARYADHALLASMSQDHLLTASLHQMYLAPLERERDGGRRLRQTLRAYFAARGQTSSAAAALRISRKTVSNHLATVEKRLGRSVASCEPSLEAALHLESERRID